MSGMGGPVAINQVAIHEAIDRYNIEYPLDCFEKVVMVGRQFLQYYNEKKKEEADK